MFALKTWEVADSLEAGNPMQYKATAPTPQGFMTTGWNQVPTTAQLAGPLGTVSSTWAGLPTWAQLLLVAGAAGTVGYFGMVKFGDKYVRPALKRVGLGGSRRRR